MRCAALCLLALAGVAAGYQIPPPSGLYETPTAAFGAEPSQLNEVSQQPFTDDRDDSFSVQQSLQIPSDEGCCGGAGSGPVHSGSQPGQPGQSSFVHTQSVQSVPSVPVHSQSSQFTESGPSSNFVTTQFTQSGPVPSQSNSFVSLQSGPSAQAPSSAGVISQGGQSQSGYYESSSVISQPAVGRPVVSAPLPRPSNMFLDNPALLETGRFSQVSQTVQTSGQAPSGNYGANVFLSGNQPSGGVISGGVIGSNSGSSSEYYEQSNNSFQHGPGAGSGPTGQLIGRPISQPNKQSSTFVSSQQSSFGPSQASHQSSFGPAPTGQQSTFVSQQSGYAPNPVGQQSGTFVSTTTTGKRPSFGGSSSNVNVQQSSFNPGRPAPQRPAFIPRQPSLPSGSGSSFTQVGSQNGFTGSQTGFTGPQSPQLLNQHPNGGGSGPLGHQLRVCSTSLVCVPLAMCNPYTGFVRGGLLFEPEEPTLQPTVALDRCTQLKDGGTGDGVCCQMPHINDPWPRDQ